MPAASATFARRPGELRAVEQAVVETEDELPPGPVERLEPECGRRERAVDAGRAVVHGRAPHPVIDADRRRDVGASEPGTAARLGRFNPGDHSGSSNSVPFGFNNAQQTAEPAKRPANSNRVTFQLPVSPTS